MESGRCLHGMIEGQCAFCQGIVTAKNQTQSGGAAPVYLSGYGMDRPKVRRFEGFMKSTGTVNFDKESPAGTGREEEVMEAREKKVCKVEGCRTKTAARGFCLKHYDRWRHGALEGDWPPFKPLKKRKGGKGGPGDGPGDGKGRGAKAEPGADMEIERSGQVEMDMVEDIYTLSGMLVKNVAYRKQQPGLMAALKEFCRMLLGRVG